VAVEFTVGIPTHNRRETVLLAVAAALAQTRPPARICVVADGCTDGTEEALEALGEERVEVLARPKGAGYGYAHRNEVLERAGDGVVAWLGDDDLWLPDHLERAGELFDAGVAGIVNSMACLVPEDGSLQPCGAHWRAPTYSDRFLSVENRTPAGAVSHLAPAAREVGGWSGEIERAGDWDLWKRIVESGVRSEIVLSPTVLFFRGTGRDQDWRDRVAQNTEFLTRIQDPDQLARLRAEMAFAWSAEAHRVETAFSHALARGDSFEYHLEKTRAELKATQNELAEVRAERDRLAADLTDLTTSVWWRMRRPFEPALWLRRRLLRRR
jgi:glycosyltransferase involved in cell wall biosynthesis